MVWSFKFHITLTRRRPQNQISADNEIQPKEELLQLTLSGKAFASIFHIEIARKRCLPLHSLISPVNERWNNYFQSIKGCIVVFVPVQKQQVDWCATQDACLGRQAGRLDGWLISFTAVCIFVGWRTQHRSSFCSLPRLCWRFYVNDAPFTVFMRAIFLRVFLYSDVLA